MTQRVHSKELMNEIMRLWEQDLKTSLSLKRITKGRIEWMPTAGIPNMVNGIWITIDPTIELTPVQWPRDLEVKYNFRVVYARRINVGENVEEQKINDCNIVVEHMIDNYRLEALSLSNAHVLWCLPTSVEMEPLEDAFVAQVAADITATAFKVECMVRTRR